MAELYRPRSKNGVEFASLKPTNMTEDGKSCVDD